MLSTSGRPLFSASIEDADGRRTVVCRGELDLSSVDALAQAVHRLTVSGLPVRIDMAGTTFMDSAGVSALLRARATEEGLGRLVTLLAPSDAVVRTLDLAGIADLFAVEPAPA